MKQMLPAAGVAISIIGLTLWANRTPVEVESPSVSMFCRTMQEYKWSIRSSTGGTCVYPPVSAGRCERYNGVLTCTGSGDTMTGSINVDTSLPKCDGSTHMTDDWITCDPDGTPGEVTTSFTQSR